MCRSIGDRAAEIDVPEADLEVTTMRAGGAGELKADGYAEQLLSSKHGFDAPLAFIISFLRHPENVTRIILAIARLCNIPLRNSSIRMRLW